MRKIKDLVNREKREIAFGVLKVMNQADYRLYNTGTFIAFEKNSENLLKKILKK
jgi:hypothetical protein